MGREEITLEGVVLYAQPVGEYDRRLVILTRSRGKITVFAHGARRPKSPLIAVSAPFVYAAFHLYEGRDAYTLVRADVASYFHEIASAIPGAFYGMYFLELASYYGREGLEAGDMINLIYVALKALIRERMNVRLIRAAFEIRMLVINGEYAVPDRERFPDETVWKAVYFAAYTPLAKLFSFDLAEPAAGEFCRYAEQTVKRTTDKTFKSLAVLEKMS